MLKYPTDVRVEHDLAIADIDRADGSYLVVAADLHLLSAFLTMRVGRADDALHTYAPLHDEPECDEAGMGHARLDFVGCRP